MATAAGPLKQGTCLLHLSSPFPLQSPVVPFEYGAEHLKKACMQKYSEHSQRWVAVSLLRSGAAHLPMADAHQPACAMAPLMASLLLCKVQQAMAQADFMPTDTVWGSLMVACGKAGQLESALGLWQAFKQARGGLRNVQNPETCNALLIACGQTYQLQPALVALSEVKQAGMAEVHSLQPFKPKRLSWPAVRVFPSLKPGLWHWHSSVRCWDIIAWQYTSQTGALRCSDDDVFTPESCNLCNSVQLQGCCSSIAASILLHSSLEAALSPGSGAKGCCLSTAA